MIEPTRPQAPSAGLLPHPAEGDQLELQALAGALPPEFAVSLRARPEWEALVEVVLDLGRPAEARFTMRTDVLRDRAVTKDDLEHTVQSVGRFTADNRAGIPGTLHRISAIRNRTGSVVGLTLRRGRALLGTTNVISDVVDADDSLLLLGPPGVGKTTMLREMARVLANDLDRRVVVVDTSNEIAGDGDVPHAGIGRARRMQVAEPEKQHRVMIEAVENHMPQVIVVDEIGTELEAQAARTIAERGVQLIATAHGQMLENVLLNPLLSDLVGGIEAVTLGDEEARRRGTQKTVLERRAPPTFHTLVELHTRDRVVLHRDVADTVDAMLRGEPVQAEQRTRAADGRIVRAPYAEARAPEPAAPGASGEADTPLRVLPFGVSRSRFEQALTTSGAAQVRLVRDLGEADVVVTLRSFYRRRPRLVRDAETRGVPVYVLRSNTVMQIEACLADLLDRQGSLAPDSDFQNRAQLAVAPRVPEAEARRRLRLTLNGRRFS